MTVLVDFQIRNLCEAGLVTPFDPALVNPASLDVRLGEMILIESAQDGWAPLCIAGHSEANPWPLRPGHFILAETMEVFNMPACIAGQFMLKSSRAREGLQAGGDNDLPPERGLQHLLAGWLDPGWHGSRLTMELTNVRQLHPIALWPGMKIGQIMFLRTAAQPLRSYAETGRYNNDPIVQASRG
jgi:dCTP deaminase